MFPRLAAGLVSSLAASGILGAAHITTGVGVVITSVVGAGATLISARWSRGPGRELRRLRDENRDLQQQLDDREEHG